MTINLPNLTADEHQIVANWLYKGWISEDEYDQAASVINF